MVYANHTPQQHLLHLTLFRICISVGLWSLGAGWALASAGETIAPKPVVPFVKEIRVDTSEEEKRVIWRFGAAPSAFSAFSLSEPARLVVDIHTSNMFAPSRTYPLGDNVIKQIRQGTHPGRLRFVLDLYDQVVPRFTVEQQDSIVTLVLPTKEIGMSKSGTDRGPTASVTVYRGDGLKLDNGNAIRHAVATQEEEPPRFASSKLRLEALVLRVAGDKKTLTFGLSESPGALNSFVLRQPMRLVIDLAGPVEPGPSVEHTTGDDLFPTIRSGRDSSRLRFVLDVEGDEIPEYNIKQHDRLVTATFALGERETPRTIVLYGSLPPSLLAGMDSPEQLSPRGTPGTGGEGETSVTAANTVPQTQSLFSPKNTAATASDNRKTPASWLESWRARIEGTAFLKNESAFRIHSPRQFSKVQNWLQTDVDITLTDWAQLTVIGRILLDPTGHLETNTHDFNAGPIDRAEASDFFQAELRELYLEVVYGDFDFRFGRQQVVWGESLGLRILDVINPQDFQEFILDDFIDARIPLWGTRIDYTFRDWVLEAVWFLDFEENRLADHGSEWQFRNSALPSTASATSAVPARIVSPKKPRDGNVRDSEFGFRLTRFLRNMDVSLNYFYSWTDFPVPFRRSLGMNDLRIEPRHKRSHLIGGTWNYAFNVFVIRGEGGINLGQHFVSNDPTNRDGITQREYLSYVIGLDWTVHDQLSANFQFFQNVILNKPGDIEEDAVNNIVSVFLRADFLNETIFPQFTALYGINFGDFLLRPQVDYQIDDYLSVRLGMDIFLGSRSGLFGQFGAPARAHRNGYFTGRNDRIFLELKRSFEI